MADDDSGQEPASDSEDGAAPFDLVQFTAKVAERMQPAISAALKPRQR